MATQTKKPPATVGRGSRSIAAKLAAPVAASTMSRLSQEEIGLLNRLLTEPVEYMDHPVFRKRNAEDLIFGDDPQAFIPANTGRFVPPAIDLIDDLDRPGESSPPLTAAQEIRLFQQFNYARYRTYRIIREHRGKRMRLQPIRELLHWHRRSLEARSRIVQANVPLVLAMAKRTRLSGVDFAELISEGNMALLRSVDKFDCSRGFKFSTYACRAIIKSFSRVAMRTSRYRGRFPTEFDPSLEKSDHLERKRETVEGDCVDELRAILKQNLAELNDIEQTVLEARFALDKAPDDPSATPKTLEEVGVLIGVTKERVRQIQNKALQKLRAVLETGILAA